MKVNQLKHLLMFSGICFGVVFVHAVDPAYSKERKEKMTSIYLCGRDLGSARRMVSTNGVLHIFVRGRQTEPWDELYQRRTQDNIGAADRWWQARAEENLPSCDPTFIHKYLALPDEPYWRKMLAPDYSASYAYIDAWTAMVLAQFKAVSYRQLFDREFRGERVANRVVIFHTAQRGRSFALPEWYHRTNGDIEQALVMQNRKEIRQLEASVYAHELAHLYGADDLYNKVREPGFAGFELMNLYMPPFIDSCVLGSLTRYAIGWTPHPPKLVNLKLKQLKIE
jgi:hypothetical protein